MYAHFLPLAMMQPAEGGGSIITFLLPLLLIGVIFYFFIIRPQRKRQQEHDAMVEALQKGDQVTTIGGIHGKITRVDDDSVLAQVDPGGVKLRLDKSAVAKVAGENEKG